MTETEVSSPESLSDRFWAKVDVRGPDECWPWIGTLSTRGYGQFFFAGQKRPAQRVAWELEHGQPFPEGMRGCHTCDNPPCVNPSHVFPGTMRDNILDASRKGRLNRPSLTRTHCKNGHALTGYNVVPQARNYRRCRQCSTDYDRARRLSQRMARWLG